MLDPEGQPFYEQFQDGLDFSYFHVHTFTMSTVRKTISLPESVAARLDKEAKKRKMSVSAIVTELVQREPERLPYAGLFDDSEDLSLRIENILQRANK